MESLHLKIQPISMVLMISIFLSGIPLWAQQSTFYLETWQASQGEQPAVSLDRVLSTPSRTGGVYTVGSLYNESEGLYDLLVAHYNFRGDVLYQDTFNLPTPGNIIAGAIATSNNRIELFITGTVYNGSTNSYDVLTIKYSPTGQVDWYNTYNGIGNGYDGGSSLLVDSDTLYVGGAITDTTGLFGALCIKYIDGGTEVWDRTITPNNRNVAIGTLSKVNPGELMIGVGLEFNNGTHRVGSGVLATSDGSTLSGFSENSQVDLDEIIGFAADADQNLYVTGYSDAAGNGDDIVTVMLDDTLGLVWESVYNGSANSDDRPSSLAIDTLGNVYVGGYTTGSNGRDFTVIKYNNSGTQQWAALYDGASHGNDEAKAVVAGKDGLVYATGSTDTLGQKDYHTRLLKASDGTTEWSASFNGLHSKDDEATSITLDDEGGLSVLGKNGLSGGKTEYMLVRYAKKELTIPPGDGAASPALAFTEQRGQLTDTSGASVKGIRFYSTGSYPPLYVQDKELSFVTASVDTSSATPDTLHRVDITFVDSKTSLMSAAGLDKLDNYRNYYLGHIPEGRSRVGQYGRVAVTDIYDDINLQLFADKSGMVYYFVIKPGGDPADIELEFSGHDALSLNSGKLQVGTSVGSFDLPAPSAFQVNSQGQEVSTVWAPAYSIAGNRVSFSSTGSYDSTKVLVVELRRPEVTSVNSQDEWVTHFGGVESFIEDLYALEVDNDGGIFVGGFTSTTNFPLVDGDLILNSNAGGSVDANVAYFNDQAVILYLTIFGGGNDDILRDITIADGSIVAVGETNSNNFPLSSGTGNANGTDAFVTELIVSTGEIGVSKIFGGNGYDTFRGISSYGVGVIIAGYSSSTNFPTVSLSGAYNQSVNNSLVVADDRDAVILELGENFETKWSTYFGGRDLDMAIDVVVNTANNHFYISGQTATNYYAASNNCSPPSQEDGFPNCHPSGASQIPFGNGTTGPVGLSLPDIFIAEFDDTKKLAWSTFYGGDRTDQISAAGNSSISINPQNNGEIALIGATDRYDTMPLNPGGGYDQAFANAGIFVAKFKDRVHTWSTGFGCLGSASSFPFVGEACAFDAVGRLFILGHTDCSPQDLVDYCTEPDVIGGVFPVCPPSSGSNAFFQGTPTSAIYQGGGDAFIASFDGNNELLYSTYFGGNNGDFIRDVTFDKNSKLHFIGQSSSTALFPWRFPNTPIDVYEQPALFGGNDGFIARLDMSLLVNSNDHVENDSRLLVFPNPGNDILNIRIPEALNVRNLPYRVFDSRGALVLSGTTGRQALLTLSLKGLPSGVYVFSLPRQSVKFIKQ